jgi:hypothetical protein
MTASGEPRPTQVVIKTGNRIKSIELESEQDELDFVLGVYPTAYRKVLEGDDVSKVLEHHIKRNDDGVAINIPSAYEGLSPGDTVSMVMGGSGDYLAFGLSVQGDMIGAKVLRIPPFVMVSRRGKDTDKDGDAEFLARLVESEPKLFTPVYVRDRQIIMVRELQRLRIDTMKARIGCAQRHRQRYLGNVFCSTSGLFPQGGIEKEFEAKRDNDAVLNALLSEESQIKSDLEEAVEATDVWQKVMSQVEGLGYSIGARLISVIQDIRRFESREALKKYVGAHVEDGNRFPRRRKGQPAGWSNEARQALFLLIDQWNRRPQSVWGQKFLANKALYQTRYPYPHLTFKHEGVEHSVILIPGTFEKSGKKYSVTFGGKTIEVEGKMKYFKGHIHKMAGWKTVTKFIEWLFAEWWKIEKTAQVSPEGQGECKAA